MIVYGWIVCSGSSLSNNLKGVLYGQCWIPYPSSTIDMTYFYL